METRELIEHLGVAKGDDLRGVVACAVREYLDGPDFHVEGNGTISTEELVEALFPERFVKADHLVVRRQRLFRVVLILAQEMHDHSTLGEPVINRFKHRILPKRWHRKTPSVVRAYPRYELVQTGASCALMEPSETGDWVKWKDVKNA